MDVLDRASPSGNLGTNLEELHTPKSISKKPEGDGGDRKKKFEFDRVLCENEAWQEVNIVFPKTFEKKISVYWENHRNTRHLGSNAVQFS